MCAKYICILIGFHLLSVATIHAQRQPPALIYSAETRLNDSMSTYDIYINSGKKIFEKSVDWAHSNTWSWIIVRDEKTKFKTIYDCFGNRFNIENIEDLKAVASNVNRIALKIKGKWGFYDRSGQLKINHSYDQVSSFYENKAAVRIADDFYVIDTNGIKLNIPYDKNNERFSFSDFDIDLGMSNFSDFEFKVITENQKKGLINKKGEIVIPVLYEDILDLNKPFKLVTVKQNGLYGVAEFGGKLIIPIQYESVFILNRYF